MQRPDFLVATTSDRSVVLLHKENVAPVARAGISLAANLFDFRQENAWKGLIKLKCCLYLNVTGLDKF